MVIKRHDHFYNKLPVYYQDDVDRIIEELNNRHKQEMEEMKDRIIRIERLKVRRLMKNYTEYVKDIYAHPEADHDLFYEYFEYLGIEVPHTDIFKTKLDDDVVDTETHVEET